MTRPNNPNNMPHQTIPVPDLGVEVIHSGFEPEWFHDTPAYDELKARHQRGLINEKYGDKKMILLGFDDHMSAQELGDTKLMTYAAVDRYGKLVHISPKNRKNHDSWDAVQDEPAYHYNLTQILANPDFCLPDTSKNPKALSHWRDGVVLNNIKRGYVKGLGLVRSDMPEYKNEVTVVSVKYGNNGKNHLLTSIVYKDISRIKEIRKLTESRSAGKGKRR